MGPENFTTVGEALRWGSSVLSEAEELRGSAARDAALLLRHVLSLTAAQLMAWPEREMAAAEREAYRAAVERRAAHEPVQYITGEQEFFGMPLGVSPAVLIPRPETELLVEAVLEELRGDSVRAVRVLDVGTGSGAIALALAQQMPRAEVTALDLSPAALAVARWNAEQLGLASRMRFVCSDLLEGLPLHEPVFDAIVSNPPYVPERDRESLHREVREFEPEQALFAGGEGMDVYRRLVPAAARYLRPGGLLALEFGYGQRDALAELLAGWTDVRFVDDLQGIPRVALARLA